MTRLDTTRRDKTIGGFAIISTGIDKMRLHVISPDLTQLDKTRLFNWWRFRKSQDLTRLHWTGPENIRLDAI